MDSHIDMETALAMLITVVDNHVPEVGDDEIFSLYQAIRAFDGMPFLRSDFAYLMEFLFDYLITHNPYALNTPLMYMSYAEDVATQEAIDRAASSLEEQTNA